MVLAKPTRSLIKAFSYALPTRLTIKCNAPIYAWLWWNFKTKGNMNND